MSEEAKRAEKVRPPTVPVAVDGVQKMGIVRCSNFRCLGLLGRDGIWRDTRNLPLEVIEVETLFGAPS